MTLYSFKKGFVYHIIIHEKILFQKVFKNKSKKLKKIIPLKMILK